MTYGRLPTGRACATMPAWFLWVSDGSSRGADTSVRLRLTLILLTSSGKPAELSSLRKIKSKTTSKAADRSVRPTLTLSARQRENDNRAGQRQYGDDEDAALWASGTAAQQRFAHRVRGEEMVLSHHPAVGDAVEEGVRPIPRGVEANGPPQRTGAPQAETEDHPGQTGREQSDGRFARVVAVAEAEENRKDDG